MIPNDDDIMMAELADQANAAGRTLERRPFDPVTDGPKLAPYVRDAVFYMRSVYVAVTTCADDYGFAHDQAADEFSFSVAQRYSEQLRREEEAMRREMR